MTAGTAFHKHICIILFNIKMLHPENAAEKERQWEIAQ